MMTDTVRDAEAHHKIDTHEKVCSERYGAVWTALQDIKRDMSNDRSSRAASDTVIHDRFNTISNRMWLAVTGVCGAAVVGLFVIAYHLLTKIK